MCRVFCAMPRSKRGVFARVFVSYGRTLGCGSRADHGLLRQGGDYRRCTVLPPQAKPLRFDLSVCGQPVLAWAWSVRNAS